MGDPSEKRERLDPTNPRLSSEAQFTYPAWWFETMRGIAILEEEEKADEAAYLRYQANQALMIWKGSQLKDAQGNPILGENDSSQHEELANKFQKLIKK